MISDLERLKRIRDIPDNAVEQLDIWTFVIKAQSDKHGETSYLVYFSPKSQAYSCTCRDYLFRNTETSPDYECKHIGKVRDLLTRRLQK